MSATSLLSKFHDLPDSAPSPEPSYQRHLPLPKYHTKNVWFYQLQIGAIFSHQDRLYVKDSEVLMHEHRKFGSKAPPVPAPLDQLVGAVPTEPLRFKVETRERVVLCYIVQVDECGQVIPDGDGGTLPYNGGVPGSEPPTPPHWALAADQSGTLLQELLQRPMVVPAKPRKARK